MQLLSKMRTLPFMCHWKLPPCATTIGIVFPLEIQNHFFFFFRLLSRYFLCLQFSSSLRSILLWISMSFFCVGFNYFLNHWFMSIVTLTKFLPLFIQVFLGLLSLSYPSRTLMTKMLDLLLNFCIIF